jgi:hypothetical protein
MRFPQADRLRLPCVLERVQQGNLHADGRRYLPTLFFRLLAPPSAPQAAGAGLLLAVVDRHHRVDLKLVGRSGSARLAFMLGTVRVQRPPFHQGFTPEPGSHGVAMRPESHGQVLHVAAWETDREHLAYEYLYTELLLDIGLGVIGVRTSATSGNITTSVGKHAVEPGDWIDLGPSRIDVLGFASENG